MVYNMGYNTTTLDERRMFHSVIFFMSEGYLSPTSSLGSNGRARIFFLRFLACSLFYYLCTTHISSLLGAKM